MADDTASECHTVHSEDVYSLQVTGELVKCSLVCKNNEHLPSYAHDCKTFCLDYYRCLNPTTISTIMPSAAIDTSQHPHKHLYIIIALLAVIVLVLAVFVTVILTKKRWLSHCIKNSSSSAVQVSHPVSGNGEEITTPTDSMQIEPIERHRLHLDSANIRPSGGQFELIREDQPLLPGGRSSAGDPQNRDNARSIPVTAPLSLPLALDNTQPSPQNMVLQSQLKTDPTVEGQPSDKTDTPGVSRSHSPTETKLLEFNRCEVPLHSGDSALNLTLSAENVRENDIEDLHPSHQSQGQCLSMSLKPVTNPSDDMPNSMQLDAMPADEEPDLGMSLTEGGSSFVAAGDIPWLSRACRDHIINSADRKDWIVSIGFCIEFVEVHVTNDVNSPKKKVLEELKLHAIKDRVQVLTVEDVEFEYTMLLDPGAKVFGPHHVGKDADCLQAAVGFFVRLSGDVHFVTSCHNLIQVNDQISNGTIQIGTCKATAFTTSPAVCDASLISIDLPHFNAQNRVKDSRGSEYSLEIFYGANTSLEGKECTKYEQNFTPKLGVVTCGDFFFRCNTTTFHRCITVSADSHNSLPISARGESGKVVILNPSANQPAVGIGMIIGVYNSKLKTEYGTIVKRGATLLAPLHHSITRLEMQPYCGGKKLSLVPPFIYRPPSLDMNTNPHDASPISGSHLGLSHVNRHNDSGLGPTPKASKGFVEHNKR